jgi:hypothetical protein
MTMTMQIRMPVRCSAQLTTASMRSSGSVRAAQPALLRASRMQPQSGLQSLCSSFSGDIRSCNIIVINHSTRSHTLPRSVLRLAPVLRCGLLDMSKLAHYKQSLPCVLPSLELAGLQMILYTVSIKFTAVVSFASSFKRRQDEKLLLTPSAVAGLSL